MRVQAVYHPNNRPISRSKGGNDTPPDYFLGRARERCVRVKTQEAKAVFGQLGQDLGSGVIIETGLVFTNYHLIAELGQITVNDHPADLVHFDLRYDLAALKTQTRRLSRIKMSTEVHQAQPVFYVGNPDACNKSWAHGYVNWISRSEIRADTAPLEGFSGSGLYDSTNCTLVGLIDSLNGGAFTIAVPCRILIPFLSETLLRFRRKDR